MIYTQTQIEAAKRNAMLHGCPCDISEAQAIQYLDWYFANKVEVGTMYEASISVA